MIGPPVVLSAPRVLPQQKTAVSICRPVPGHLELSHAAHHRTLVAELALLPSAAAMVNVACSPSLQPRSPTHEVVSSGVLGDDVHRLSGGDFREESTGAGTAPPANFQPAAEEAGANALNFCRSYSSAGSGEDPLAALMADVAAIEARAAGAERRRASATPTGSRRASKEVRRVDARELWEKFAPFQKEPISQFPIF